MTNTRIFSTRILEGLKPQAVRYSVWETGRHGFGIRITDKHKTFVYVYRINGKQRWLTIGRFPAVSLARAHEIHAQAVVAVEASRDPAAEAQGAKLAERGAPTVSELVDRYLEEYAKVKKRAWREDERMLRKDVIPAWGTRKVSAIERKDVKQLLGKISQRGNPLANRTQHVISKLFSFAVQEDIIQTNPCAGVPLKAVETAKERTLTTDELRTLWANLDELPARAALPLKLIIATGQRPGECLGISKPELDLPSGWWTLDKERSKNKKPHRVPLNAVAQGIVKQAIELADSEHLFGKPSVYKRTNILSGSVRKYADKLGIDTFTPHDLRRTVASHMGRIGISPFVISKVLNHTFGGTARVTLDVYLKYGFDKEKREALDKWGRELERIISGEAGNVLQFPRA